MRALDLSSVNRTTDAEINTTCEREGRVLVTRDADLVNSFLLSGEPYKPLLVSIGNTGNAELEALLAPRLSEISILLSTYDYAELTKRSLITHA